MIEQRIPDHIIYGSPEECRIAIAQPLRCYFDPYWRWPAMPKPLSFWHRWMIDRAVARRYRQLRHGSQQ